MISIQELNPHMYPNLVIFLLFWLMFYLDSRHHYRSFCVIWSFNSVRKLQVLHFLNNRNKVHHDSINFCQEILRKKSVEWKAVHRNDLTQPINDVDLVVTIGGDGTLLQASHFIDDKIPVLGVNSDPTRIDEVYIHVVLVLIWIFWLQSFDI